MNAKNLILGGALAFGFMACSAEQQNNLGRDELQKANPGSRSSRGNLDSHAEQQEDCQYLSHLRKSYRVRGRVKRILEQLDSTRSTSSCCGNDYFFALQMHSHSRFVQVAHLLKS